MIKNTLIVFFILGVYTTKIVDFETKPSLSTLQCVKNNGITFISCYAFFNISIALQNARSLGLSTDIVIEPCRGKNATIQVNQIFNNISSSLFNRVWIEIQPNPTSQCSWNHPPASNCDYVKEILSSIFSHNKKGGILTSVSSWKSIMGSQNYCSQIANNPLWYFHYDNNPSFNDFNSFGGWTKPQIKQYTSDTTFCGSSVGYSYHS